MQANANETVKRKSKLFAHTCVVVTVLLIIVVLALLIIRTFNHDKTDTPTVSKLYTLWQEGEYENVYTASSEILKTEIQNVAAISFKGYSAFYLAISQTDSTLSQQYIDESINNLRIALSKSNKKNAAQLQYMLGKAYFHKDNISSYHYYADLVIKYLNLAKANGYVSADISEYLGLSYASLNMVDESIAAFTEALKVRESDVLLLAIAQQYVKNSNYDIAKQYIYRINYDSDNDILIQKSRLLLADIYIIEKRFDEALLEYQEIISKDENSADAYYGMGLVYEQLGDTAKARAEWRKVLKIQVNHQGAIKKLRL